MLITVQDDYIYKLLRNNVIVLLMLIEYEAMFLNSTLRQRYAH